MRKLLVIAITLAAIGLAIWIARRDPGSASLHESSDGDSRGPTGYDSKRIAAQTEREVAPRAGRVAELADARDLKSRGGQPPCGFDPRLGHCRSLALRAGIRSRTATALRAPC